MKAEEVWTQLATRIPKELHRQLKLHCMTHDIAVMHFVTEAIEEKLGRKTAAEEGAGVRGRCPLTQPPRTRTRFQLKELRESRLA